MWRSSKDLERPIRACPAGTPISPTSRHPEVTACATTGAFTARAWFATAAPWPFRRGRLGFASGPGTSSSWEKRGCESDSTETFARAVIDHARTRRPEDGVDYRRTLRQTDLSARCERLSRARH